MASKDDVAQLDNGDAELNGANENGKENVENEDSDKNNISKEMEDKLAKEPVKAQPSLPMSVEAIHGVVSRVKDDPNIPEKEKIDTLCLLVQRYVVDNQTLKNEIEMVTDQVEKHKEAKEALRTLNETYKKQIALVKEESKLRLEEEQSKRQDSMGGYNETMSELSTLLDAHSGQNSKMKEQNGEMSEQMTTLLKETEKREAQIERMQTEYELQLKLLEHQVAKANIEKAEVKANMTQERLIIAQELTVERDRSANLEQTVRLLREQADIYQKQMTEIASGAGKNSKSFQHFKTQIDKLTKQMSSLERETAQWREKSELSTKQVKKMNQLTMEKEKELTALKKKLESMIKLNKTLSAERSELMAKVKSTEDSNAIAPDK